MIPNLGCDPKVNILTIGAKIISILKDGPVDAPSLLVRCSNEMGVSMDHVILSIDWLYIISAVNTNNEMVSLNETN